MTILSTESLVKILDVQIDRPSWTNAMALVGGTESLAFNWLARSRRAADANDRASPLYLEWPVESGIWMWFHQHINNARAANVALIEAKIREESLHGRPRVVRDSMQQVIFQRDPRYLHHTDDYIRFSEGLGPDDDVLWYRYLHNEAGEPVPETVCEPLAAPLRLAVLKQDPRYIEKSQVDVQHSGVVQISKPLTRLPNDPPARPMQELRELLKLTAAERRARLGASAYPLDANGRRTLPQLSPPLHERSDDQGEFKKPGETEPFQRPQQATPAPEAPRPSYAKPSPTLDHSGRGDFNPPAGGFKVA